MNPTLKNILAFIGGAIIGGTVNMLLVNAGHFIVPAPEGYDESNMETMKATFHLLQTKHLIMPFFAHAIGTLVAAFIITKIAATRAMLLSLIVGGLFFIGGLMMVLSLSAPIWFNALDLVVAYIPMAWLGNKLAGGGK